MKYDDFCNAITVICFHYRVLCNCFMVEWEYRFAATSFLFIWRTMNSISLFHRINEEIDRVSNPSKKSLTKCGTWSLWSCRLRLRGQVQVMVNLILKIKKEYEIFRISRDGLSPHSWRTTRPVWTFLELVGSPVAPVSSLGRGSGLKGLKASRGEKTTWKHAKNTLTAVITFPLSLHLCCFLLGL